MIMVGPPAINCIALPARFLSNAQALCGETIGQLGFRPREDICGENPSFSIEVEVNSRYPCPHDDRGRSQQEFEDSYNLIIYQLNGIRWAASLMGLAFALIKVRFEQRAPPPLPIPLIRLCESGLFVDAKNRLALMIRETFRGPLSDYSLKEQFCESGHNFSDFMEFIQHLQLHHTSGLAFVTNLQGRTSVNSCTDTILTVSTVSRGVLTHPDMTTHP
jgi:hypothetical protein